MALDKTLSASINRWHQTQTSAMHDRFSLVGDVSCLCGWWSCGDVSVLYISGWPVLTFESVELWTLSSRFDVLGASSNVISSPTTGSTDRWGALRRLTSLGEDLPAALPPAVDMAEVRGRLAEL